MDRIVLCEDISVGLCSDGLSYEGSFEYGGASVEICLCLGPEDLDIPGIRSLFEDWYRALAKIEEMVRSYLGTSVDEDTLKILREYRDEPSLSADEILRGILLGTVRIREDGGLEYDYIYDKGRFLTGFRFEGIDRDSFSLRYTFTNDKYE